MRIVIVGAGIAGLTLALALHRHGVGSVVLEQAHRPGPPGTGVQVPPPVVHRLRGLGVGEALDRRGVRPTGVDILEWRDSSPLESMPLGADYERRFGAPYYTMLRSELHETLLEALPEGTVQTGNYVTDVLEGTDAVTLWCADGTRVHADVVIAADGAHSTVREAVFPGHSRPSELRICRGRTSVPRVPELGGARIRVWPRADRYFTCYPVEGGRTVSFGAILPGRPGRLESWAPRQRVDDLLDAFAGWNGQVTEVISAAEWIGVWTPHRHTPVRAWCRGRIALMGDAAHPMLPFLPQGVGQSVEDAVVLADLLRESTGRTVEETLERYAETRREQVGPFQEEFSLELLGSLSELRAAGALTGQPWARGRPPMTETDSR
ncbi:FAD-dependent monooxygenase [Thermobifida halotolerans]|uniref:FAD-dependent monooxygenase n=1 Tax=Thermobifida halotolerans TaxID=483545 RepID=A0AA97M1W3_9ACTN|nr:NAD(P)/FAD-dependent oxidoreductase [Thermobifida halotolerans]UOE17804.1 FAD-dependent monooxygenase [Thermobifida halotolerans]